MTRYQPLFLLFIGLLMWQSASAQPGDWGLPPSPNGQLASALLDAINDPDPDVHQQFIETHYAPAFKDQISMDRHLQQFQYMHQDLAGAQITGLDMMMGATAMLSLMMKTEAEEYFKLQLEIEQGEAPRLVGLNVEESMEGPPPTERMISAVLDVIESSNPKVHRKFVEEHFSPAFRDELPMETHLKLLQQMHEDLAGATMLGAEAMSRGGSDETITLTLKTKEGKRFAVTFDVQMSSPPRLITLSATPE